MAPREAENTQFTGIVGLALGTEG